MSGRSTPRPADKACLVCGRAITWRRTWERDGEQVRYCSSACRSRGGQHPQDRALEVAIGTLLAARAHDASICPSEAARQVGGEQWRELMEPARAAARRMVVAEEVEIVQGGQVVDPSTAKGPIRVRRARP